MHDMRLSFSTLATPGMDIREVAALARRSGYQGVDLRVSPEEGELTLGSPGTRIRDVRHAFAAEGVAIASLFCYDTPDVDYRRWLPDHLELAAAVGAEAIRIFAAPPGGVDRRAALQGMAAQVRTALDAHAGADIVVQHHAGTLGLAEALELWELVAHARFGIAFSPDHCVETNEPFDVLAPRLRRAARQLYVADAIKRGSDWKTVFPGEGVVPNAAAWEALEATGTKSDDRPDADGGVA